MPKVLNQKKDKIPEDAVYIGRPSIFGNPYIVGIDGSRTEVIEKYRRYLALNTSLREEVIKQLKGKDLVCWCSPKQCHGDVLIDIANNENIHNLFE